MWGARVHPPAPPGRAPPPLSALSAVSCSRHLSDIKTLPKIRQHQNVAENPDEHAFLMFLVYCFSARIWPASLTAALSERSTCARLLTLTLT